MDDKPCTKDAQNYLRNAKRREARQFRKLKDDLGGEKTKGSKSVLKISSEIDKLSNSEFNDKLLDLLNSDKSSEEMLNFKILKAIGVVCKKFPFLAIQFKQNVTILASLLMQHKSNYSLFMDSLVFVLFINNGIKKKEAYYTAFPEKLIEHKDCSDVMKTRYVNSFYNSPLVVNLLKFTEVKNHIKYGHLIDEGIETLSELHQDKQQKGLVRMKAAEAIINFAKKPDDTKGVQEEESLPQANELSIKEQLKQMSAKTSSADIIDAVTADIVRDEGANIDKSYDTESKYKDV